MSSYLRIAGIQKPQIMVNRSADTSYLSSATANHIGVRKYPQLANLRIKTAVISSNDGRLFAVCGILSTHRDPYVDISQTWAGEPIQPSRNVGRRSQMIKPQEKRKHIKVL